MLAGFWRAGGTNGWLGGGCAIATVPPGLPPSSGEPEVDVGEEVVARIGLSHGVDRADDGLIGDVGVGADRDLRLAGEIGGEVLEPLHAGVERRVVVVTAG